MLPKAKFLIIPHANYFPVRHNGASGHDRLLPRLARVLRPRPGKQFANGMFQKIIKSTNFLPTIKAIENKRLLRPAKICETVCVESTFLSSSQPGCYDSFLNVISCSHSRARELFISSVVKAICLAGKECKGDPHIIPKNCMDIISSAEIVTMGYWWNTADPTPGMYTVDVTGYEPYCAEPTKKS
jgi:hypothetical protein